MNNKYMTSDDVKKFKSYMVGAGYNITSLAEAIGMKREVLSSRISGKVDFKRNEMNLIAKVLNVSPEKIFLS